MARQKLGQHFLISEKVLDRIATAAVSSAPELVVEIGPGKGALTSHLLERGVKVAGIELDPELAEELRSTFAHNPLFEILETNALHVNYSRWGAGVLAGNLPYYVATPLISRYLRNPGLLTQGVFLIQKEVAERITAKPGTRDYGYFSVECQYLATTEYLFTVPPGAFRPPPKVDSGVIRLTPKSPNPEIDTDSFLGFASACFRQKRKTIRNNLYALYREDTLDTLPYLQQRAEQLALTELLELHASLTRRTRKVP